jgi:hypothetical protein
VTGAASCRLTARSCLAVTGRGAGALLPGGGVQVVVTFQDAQGRHYLLRDEQAQLAR